MKKLLLGSALLLWSVFMVGCSSEPLATTIESDTLITFDQASVDKAVEDGKYVAVYFGAWRCPSCQSMIKNIEENVASLPDDIVIFAADIDRDTDAMTKYWVNWKHTTVYISPDGEQEVVTSKKEYSLDQILTFIEGLRG